MSDVPLLAEVARRSLRERADAAVVVGGELPAQELAVLHLGVEPDGHLEGYDAATSDTIATQVACDANFVYAEVTTTRTIPPRVRTIVLDRDRVVGARCRVVAGGSGATSITFARSFWAVGTYPRNLLTLCACHHRLIHEGNLRVEVDDATGGSRGALGRVSMGPAAGAGPLAYPRGSRCARR